MCSRTLKFALLCASVTLASLPGYAQDVAGAAESEEETEFDPRRAYDEGAAAFERGEHAEALVLFQRIYDETRLPTLLFNIGSCHDRLGHAEEASRHYRAYLAAQPDAENADYVQSRLVILQVDEPEVSPAPEPVVEEAPRNYAPEPDAGPSRAGPITLMTLGGASIAGAVVTGVLTVQSRSDLESMCDELECPRDAEDTHDRMRRRALLTDILGGAGIALLGTGLIWLLLQPDAEDDNASVDCGVGGCSVNVRW